MKFIPGQNFSKNQIIKAVDRLKVKSGKKNLSVDNTSITIKSDQINI